MQTSHKSRPSSVYCLLLRYFALSSEVLPLMDVPSPLSQSTPLSREVSHLSAPTRDIIRTTRKRAMHKYISYCHSNIGGRSFAQIRKRLINQIPHHPRNKQRVASPAYVVDSKLTMYIQARMTTIEDNFD